MVRKTFSTENAYRSHVQSKKHREREIMHARALQQGQEVGAEDDSDDDEGDEEEEARDGAQEEDMDQEMGTSSSIRPTSPGSEHTDSDEEGDIETRLASARRRRHQPSDCLFCSTKSSSIETCLKHMSSVHSFFLPDSDHLVDLPGLLAYLGEKVIVGNICLYCPGGNKEFGSLEAVRRHMIDKSHCKVAFEDDDDRAELSDYYDFAIGGAGDEWEDVEDDGDHDMDAPFRNTVRQRKD
jgi:pre-60S factor REI1